MSFCKCAVKYGYTAKFTPITDLLRERDFEVWKKSTVNHCLNDLLPMKRTQNLQDKGHDSVFPLVRTERFKQCSINKCLFNFI